MRLCVDARMICSSGIGRVIKNIVMRLHQRDLLLIVSPEAMEKEPWLKDIETITAKSPIYSVQEQWELSLLIPKGSFFWSPHYNVPVMPTRAAMRMTTIHDICHLAFPSSFSWKEKAYAKFMLHQAILRSDKVTTVSHFSKREIGKRLGVNTDSIQVIYSGIDFNFFSTPSPFLEIVKKKYSLPHEFYLFVGNLKTHKNLRAICSAYATKKLEIPLIIVGKGNGLRNSDTAIIQTVRNEGLIHLVGEIPDEELPAFYQLAAAFVFPSLYEGFGFPPLEAMAAGCPAIVSNCASIPEICGEAAHYVDPRNPYELAESMIFVRENRSYRMQLIQKGIQQASKYSWDSSAREYANAFFEMECKTALH